MAPVTEDNNSNNRRVILDEVCSINKGWIFFLEMWIESKLEITYQSLVSSCSIELLECLFSFHNFKKV